MSEVFSVKTIPNLNKVNRVFEKQFMPFIIEIILRCNGLHCSNEMNGSNNEAIFSLYTELSLA